MRTKQEIRFMLDKLKVLFDYPLIVPSDVLDMAKSNMWYLEWVLGEHDE